jgi:hypothetical protein
MRQLIKGWKFGKDCMIKREFYHNFEVNVLKVQNDFWETNCLVCGNKIEDGFRPTITQEYLYSEAGKEYRCLDHTDITNLYLCKKCEEEFRQTVWNCFSDILKRQNEE